jgi:hypothetical protein
MFELLIILPFGLIVLLLQIIFSKKNVEQKISKEIKEMKGRKKNSFIEWKKYDFDKKDGINQTILATLAAVFLGLKVLGIVEAMLYWIMGCVFVGFFIFYIKLSKFHCKVIERLSFV